MTAKGRDTESGGERLIRVGVNVLIYAGPIVGLVVGGLAMAGGGCLARHDGAYPLAMKELSSCDAAAGRLGPPIEQPTFGKARGSSRTQRGGFGTASWSIPVKGSKASGTYRYAAEMHGGSWQLLKASVEVDGEKIAVFPCASGWFAQSREASRGSERLLQAFGREGTIRAASGRTGATAGQRCEVSVTPNVDFGTKSHHNCRVVVRCGPTVLYGWDKSGYTTCTTDAGLPVRANDPFGTAKDTDPILELDIPQQRVVVRDDNPASTWSVEITW